MARREWNVGRNGEFVWLAKSAGFRRNPQQHAGTGAIRQEKTPTENGWGFNIGGGGGSRTHVRKTYDQSYYTVSPLIDLVARLYSGQDSLTTVPGFQTT